MSMTLVRMKVVPNNAAFCKQLVTMSLSNFFRWFSSSSLTIHKAPTTIGITVALTSHNSCNCNLSPGIWWLFLVPSLWCFGLQEQLCRWFCIFSFFINDYEIWTFLFYFLICLDCKVPKYFPFAIFQHEVWFMWEPFVFTFNLKFPAQEPMHFFYKFVVSPLVLVSS